MIKPSQKLSTLFLYLVNNILKLPTLVYTNCLICKEQCTQTQSLCTECTKDLPWNKTHCYQCALPINKVNVTNTIICGECIKQPPPFEKTISPFLFSFPINKLLTNAKFNRSPYLLKPLGKLVAHEIKKAYLEDSLPELIIPVPLHQSKERTRGFNQSIVIAKRLSKQIKIQLASNAVKKTAASEQTSLLTKDERLKELKNSFHLASNADLKDKHITIVDDIMTTKATASELARLLKLNGARRVDIWCIARTAKH